MSRINQKIAQKYSELGENPESYLEGLLHSKPINYWDYIGVETLLSLQRPRTNFKDEEIFIMYHQMTELLLKMLLHEIKQLVETDSFSEEIWLDKINRMNRYVSMLINSFDIMKDGMDYEDYNRFRTALAPASGFQSVQFRYIEIYCTKLENLVKQEEKKQLPGSPSTEDYFENIYWKKAGINKKTGDKTLTMLQFEEKYLDSLITLAKKVKGQSLEEQFLMLKKPSEALQKKLLEFDKLYNIEWPLVHLNTAQHYLDKKGENKAATGGSEWKKYLHPKFQQRKFFPSLWTKEDSLVEDKIKI
ncbi:tryptophan 2,3-dioxygenase family protein [Christiangramia forsetii]|uniref:Tryptophan 2,3-dioxygenase n=2 Tax=Christiangramia forsetii TaxID=411153 RepID=A0M172_CHRFK|nr:tryptophan 2,3-dioxygenase family protein [Christiangramia forsetii]GGG43196.1 tryptophan 2,3-dioxygenase [Christiangramia forsetii]CAL66367.1 tryptophan 2,3-dioxygenase [Christiangramia forsetii KT0803]